MNKYRNDELPNGVESDISRYDVTNGPNIALMMYPSTRSGYATGMVSHPPLVLQFVFVSPRSVHFLGNNCCNQKRELPHSLYDLNTEILCVMMSHLPDKLVYYFFSWLTGHINYVPKTIQQYSVNNQHKSANSNAQKIFYTLGQQNMSYSQGSQLQFHSDSRLLTQAKHM